jgi:hypothetical protein
MCTVISFKQDFSLKRLHIEDCCRKPISWCDLPPSDIVCTPMSHSERIYFHPVEFKIMVILLFHYFVKSVCDNQRIE